MSGAQSYKSLCLAAKNEENRQAELRKRVQYRKEFQQKSPSTKGTPVTTPKPPSQGHDRAKGKWWRCYNCGQQGHLSCDCKALKKESSGKGRGQSGPPARTNTIDFRTVNPNDPRKYLYPGPVDSDVHLIRVDDDGSAWPSRVWKPEAWWTQVLISWEVNCSRKLLQLPDCCVNSSRSLTGCLLYDNKPFKLDGAMELAVSFGGKVITTPVYIKMDAEDQLLLSEGLCIQLGVVTYHGEVTTEASQGKPEEDSAKINSYCSSEASGISSVASP